MDANGLEGVVVAATALSDVDGERGRLVIRGHDVEQLALQHDFEAVCALLWNGALPDAAEHAALRGALAAARVRAFARLPTLGDALGAGDAMDALRAALGIPADAQVGDPVHASLGEAGPLDGVIDYATPEFLGVRAADGLYRFFGRNHYGSVVGMSAHLFVDGVDAAAQETALKEWLDGLYAAVR